MTADLLCLAVKGAGRLGPLRKVAETLIEREEELEACPLQPTIAGWAGVSERSFRRALSSLKQLGGVTVHLADGNRRYIRLDKWRVQDVIACIDEVTS